MKRKKQSPKLTSSGKDKSSGKERCFIFYDIEAKSPDSINRSGQLRKKIYDRCKSSKEMVHVQRSVFAGKIEKDVFINEMRNLFSPYVGEIGINSNIRIVPERDFDDMRSIIIEVVNNVPKVRVKKSVFGDFFK